MDENEGFLAAMGYLNKANKKHMIQNTNEYTDDILRGIVFFLFKAPPRCIFSSCVLSPG